MSIDELVQETAHCFSKGEQKLVYRGAIDLEKSPSPYNAFCCQSDEGCPFYRRIEQHEYCLALHNDRA